MLQNYVVDFQFFIINLPFLLLIVLETVGRQLSGGIPGQYGDLRVGSLPVVVVVSGQAFSLVLEYVLGVCFFECFYCLFIGWFYQFFLCYHNVIALNFMRLFIPVQIQHIYNLKTDVLSFLILL